MSSDESDYFSDYEGIPMVNTREHEEIELSYLFGGDRPIVGDTATKTTCNPRSELFNSTRYGVKGQRRKIDIEMDIQTIKCELGIDDVCYMACCSVCSDYCESNTIPRAAKLGRALRSSTFLRSNGGCLLAIKENVLGVLQGHKNSKLHRYILLQNDQLDIRLAIDRALYSNNEILVRVMRTAVNVVARYGSFLSFENDVRLQILNGAVMGNRNHSRKAMREIVLTIGDVFLEDMRTYATSTHPISGHLLYLGNMADKITDLNTKQWQAQMHFQQYSGRRTLFITGLASVTYIAATVAGVAPAAAAGGRACFDKIDNTLQVRAGIDLHADVRENGQTIQVRSHNFDGEAVYQGQHSGVKHYLHHADGIGDPTQYVGWDPCHDQDLANGALGTDEITYISETIDKTVKEVYAHFSRSPQKLRGLEDMAESLGISLKQLHYLFEVRFIESQIKAYTAFIHDIPIIVQTLETDLSFNAANGGPKQDKRRKMQKWCSTMTSLKFVSMLGCLLDVHTISKIYSKKCQSDTMFVLDLPTYREQLMESIDRLTTSAPGQLFVENGFVKKYLPGWKVGKHVSKDGVEVKIKLQGRPANTTISDYALARTKHYLDEIASELLDLLKEKLLPPPISFRLREMFDVRRMAFINNNNENAGSLDTHGHDAIDWIVLNEFKHLDATQLKYDLKLFLTHVQKNKATFEMYTTKKKEGKPRTNFNRTIDLSGVFEYFSTNSTAGEMKQLVEVIDYVLSFATGSCAVERLGRVMNLTKTSLRAALGDEIFFHLIFLKFQMPALEDFDWERILTKWYADGHMNAVSNARDMDDGLVMKRRREEEKVRSKTPIGTKKPRTGTVGTAEHLPQVVVPLVEQDFFNNIFNNL